jgi:hypothetical protein
MVVLYVQVYIQGAEIQQVYVLSMGTMLSLGEVFTSEQKCFKKAG